MEIIDQIRQASSIVEIASQYTTLRKRGRKWVGLCPFHSEKGPSFTVDEEKQLFHCFGCGVGGDVFSLIMEKESLNFPEALRHLAEKYRIPLPEQQRISPQALKLEEKLFKVNEMAQSFFRKNLFHTQEGLQALDYLKKRKISDTAVEELKIGYALNSWNSLLSYFREKGVQAALLEKGGLVLAGQKAGEFYDRFRGRIIFPISSLTGKIVAFGGRTIINAEPKYLNSPDTPLYSKGKLLYGLNFSKEAVREAGEAILVEGYTDFSALYQAGIRNVVASLGTALTPFQVAQALRFAPRMVVNYDGDDAGLAACARAIPICFEKGMAVEALVLPEKLDPDAFLKKYGKERYLQMRKKAVPGLKFLIMSHSAGAKANTPEDKGRIARAVFMDIEKVPDPLVRSEFLKELSGQIGIDEALLRNLVTVKPAEADGEGKRFFLPAEKRLLQILMEDRAVAPGLLPEVRAEDFRGLRGEPVFSILLDCLKASREWSAGELKDKVAPPLYQNFSQILNEKTDPPTLEEALRCLFSLRKFTLQNELKRIQAEIVQSEKKGEKERVLALLYQKQDVTKQILSL